MSAGLARSSFPCRGAGVTDDRLHDLFPGGVLETPADGAVLVGLLTAESREETGSAPVIAAVAAAGIEAGLPVGTVVQLVRYMRKHYAKLLATPAAADPNELSWRFARLLVEALVRVLPDEPNQDVLFSRLLARYSTVLDACAGEC